LMMIRITRWKIFQMRRKSKNSLLSKNNSSQESSSLFSRISREMKRRVMIIKSIFNDIF
jgi:hypothetical protein